MGELRGYTNRRGISTGDYGCRKSSEKKDKELVLRQAVSDAKLWEVRFQAVEKSRETYRENGRRLMQENEQLQVAISQVRCVQ